MNLTIGGALAGAAALWRRERSLLIPVAGVFYFVPMLAMVMLLASSGVTDQATPEQMREAIAAFYSANLPAIVAANLAIDFGSFALLNLFLQGGGRTLGQVLGMTLRRFLPFLAIDIIGSALMGLGLSLFILPGLFVFVRTWLAAPAFAAGPERGPLDAFRQGWRLSGGTVWAAILGCAALVLLASLFAVMVATGLVAALAAILGGPAAAMPLAYAAMAATGALACTWLALVRVAIYRASAERQGI